MTVKDYLLQIPALRNRIATAECRIDDFLTEACRSTSRLTAVNYGGTDRHSRVETFVCRSIDEEREDLWPMREALWHLEQEAMNVIGAMPDGKWGQVLEMRYVRGWKWGRIAQEMGITKQYVLMLHGHALIVFAKINNACKCTGVFLS